MLDKPTFRWCDETVDLLLSAIANGLSASETSSALGDRYRDPPTRSAILGKAHRLGLNFGERHGKRSVNATERRKLFPWTEPAIERFRDLVAAGMSSSEIVLGMAKAFHAAPRLSTSAVQQRASILGLSIRGGVHGPRKNTRTPVPMAAAPLRPAQDSGLDVGSSPDIEPATAFPNGGVTLLDLEFGMCRWIQGDPRDIEAHRYCGAKARAGQSYCVSHHALAYVPTNTRKRTKSQEDADDKRRAYAMKQWASGLRASGARA